jgi:hypothetical protein
MKHFITFLMGSIILSSSAFGYGRIPSFDALKSGKFRTINGQGNNKIHSNYGKAHTPLLRKVRPSYEDGFGILATLGRKSPRRISNIVCKTKKLIPNPASASDYLWQWGQFLDHDIDLTEASGELVDRVNIPVPLNDLLFNPGGFIDFARSEFVIDNRGFRQQLNFITSFIDGSNVYGSDSNRARKLRTLDGTGMLKTSRGNLLPFNTFNPPLPNAAAGPPNLFFIAGDVRANEQIGLTAMHTLFVREHNYLAKLIRKRNPRLDGNEIYQIARKIVGAELQAITYREYIPALLTGKKDFQYGRRSPLKPYKGYKKEIKPQIANVFSTALFRYGHSNLSPQILRLDKHLREIRHGNVPLKNAFFNPPLIIEEGGIAPILRGLAHQVSQNIDVRIVDGLRNFLFGDPGQGGLDLASLNIQRGRDHGLPSYNKVRKAYGLARKKRFEDISSNPVVVRRLKRAYETVAEIDVWVGALAEDHYKDALVGELTFFGLKDQWERLRDGDRFYYERDLPKVWVNWVNKQTLHKIIVRNTKISSREIPKNVFFVPQRPQHRNYLVGN